MKYIIVLGFLCLCSLLSPVRVNAATTSELVTSYLEADAADPDIWEICAAAGEKYGLCPELLEAIIERESSGNPLATNGECVGLMQIDAKWHIERMKRLNVTDLTDPYSNIMVGSDYLSELFRQAEESGIGADPYYVLMRYSQRKKSADKQWKEGRYSAYAKGICERACELERQHGK